MRLIVADDSAAMRTLVCDSLRFAFPDIIEAADGRALLWQLLRATIGTHHEPALDGSGFGGLRRTPTRRCGGSIDVVVIADVCMPTYSGLEVLGAWHDEHAPVPIVVITSFPDEIVRARVAALGATLLPKPFTRAALRAAVQAATREALRS